MLSARAYFPHRFLARTWVIAAIVLLHVGAMSVFNSGFGWVKKWLPTLPMTVVKTPIIVHPDTTPPPQTDLSIDRHISRPDDPLKQLPKISPQDDHKIDIKTGTDTDPGVPSLLVPPIPDLEVPSPRLTVLERVDPVYPAAATRAGREGVVWLGVLVNEQGRVVQANIAQSSGYVELDDAALVAVKLWRFSTSATGGKLRIPVRFKLVAQR